MVKIIGFSDAEPCNIIGFVSAFFLFAILRHATYPIEVTHERPYYLYMISQIGCVLIGF